jgi:hypothetical protein
MRSDTENHVYNPRFQSTKEIIMPKCDNKNAYGKCLLLKKKCLDGAGSCPKKES